MTTYAHRYVEITFSAGSEEICQQINTQEIEEDGANVTIGENAGDVINQIIEEVGDGWVTFLGPRSSWKHESYRTEVGIPHFPTSDKVWAIWKVLTHDDLS